MTVARGLATSLPTWRAHEHYRYGCPGQIYYYYSTWTQIWVLLDQ